MTYLPPAPRTAKDGLEHDRWTRQHLLEILRGKASRVAAGIRRSATLRQMGTERKPADECADYLLHYSPYLHYDKALAEGVPIAIGVIEGACRHLIEDRMNLTGARWSLEGALYNQGVQDSSRFSLRARQYGIQNRMTLKALVVMTLSALCCAQTGEVTAVAVADALKAANAIPKSTRSRTQPAHSQRQKRRKVLYQAPPLHRQRHNPLW